MGYFLNYMLRIQYTQKDIFDLWEQFKHFYFIRVNGSYHA